MPAVVPTPQATVGGLAVALAIAAETTAGVGAGAGVGVDAGVGGVGAGAGVGVGAVGVTGKLVIYDWFELPGIMSHSWILVPLALTPPLTSMTLFGLAIQTKLEFW